MPQMRAMMPSPIMAPEKMKRPELSFCMQRAISGDWVAWKPETAPQAMVMNSSGQSGRSVGCRLEKSIPVL